ncbi:HigA family addiction module antitoxin [Youngiibacter fragilis]|uniref:XRE family transcriptional regulator n=1 Tax=Youngiibacter fragilis 232.1 TaxID=994573 RepID=V7I7X4_9CLOT|nr:HigA family addiction module antitoxin [Youngiibacter fragilis]ETA81381.1 XRE family transcriptional regulator [Youngiibacter fragilis 232.1]
MARRNENIYSPAVAVPPGETIRENMEFLGMNQKELAARLDITEKHLSNVLGGISPITYDTAIKLEHVIGPSAEFWLELETGYQLNKLRIEEESNIEEEKEILKVIPYREISEFGWVEKTNDRNRRVINLREFYSVSTLQAIRRTYAVALRTQKSSNEVSDYGALAWLRKAETEGLDHDVEEFSKSKLRKMIPKFRELTMKSAKESFPEMEKLCAEAGIALVLVKYVPKTYICGATFWRNNKAIVALSVRGKRADVFWFTFFHEVAHLLKHTRKEVHINYEKSDEEYEADEIGGH